MAFERKFIHLAQKEEALWMPVYTQPRHEFRLYRYFQERRIPAYLPVVTSLKKHQVQAGGRAYAYSHPVWRPMFKSYIFAQLTEEQKRSVWRSNSILKIWPVTPEEQRRLVEELRGIQLLEHLAQSSGLEFRHDIRVRDRFMIDSAPYEGTCGYLLEKRKKFLWVVQIEFLGTSIVAEIDPSAYEMHKVE